MAKLSKKLAKSLKSLRGEETQRDFAQKLGIDVATLNRVEPRNREYHLSDYPKDV